MRFIIMFVTAVCVLFLIKWGKIGSSQLLNENGDLSFLFYFSKQCLVGNIQGKFHWKTSLVNFISEESR